MACPAAALWSKPSLSRFVYYKLLTLIPVSAALIGITRHASSILWTAGYVALCLAHAAVMNAIKCPHCPYYRMGDKTFSCFIWWKAPRLYQPRPGPESRFVAVYAPIGMAVLTIYPVFWLWQEWELLLLYLLSIVVLVLSIGYNECSRCLNFDCGHNTVSEGIRKEYREVVGSPAGSMPPGESS